MKRILLLSVVTACNLWIAAAVGQTVSLFPLPFRPETKSDTADSGNLPTGQAWYGHYKGYESTSAFGVGFPKEQDVNNAIFVSGTDPVCKGKTIKGLRFKIQGAGDIDNITGWLAPSLTVPVDSDLIVSVPVDENTVVDGEWIEIELPDGYPIPEEGVYAGYSVHTYGNTHASQFVGFTTNDNIGPEGALYNFETAFMSGWQWYGDRMGKLCYQVLLEGDFPTEAVTAGDFGTNYVIKDETAWISVPFRNLGTAGIESMDYVIVTNGTEGTEQHLDLDEPFNYFSATIPIDIPFHADEQTAQADKAIIVTKVNGKPNSVESSLNKGEGTLVTLAEKSHRRALVETYTGTWCGWCPRALVGIEKLKEMFGEDYIAVEAHVGMMDDTDPMSIPAYEELKDDAKGYPISVFSREYSGDPYSGLSREEIFEAPAAVEGILSGIAEASVSVSANWTNDTKSRINTETETTFQFDSNTSHYAIGYIVKADNLTGEGEEWMQTSFYMYFAEDKEYAPGTELYEDFRFWLEQPEELVAGYAYNDVAVAAYGLESGIPSSISTPLATGIPQKFSYTISVANNPLISNKDNIKVVAFLIDTETGRIVNADQCEVKSLTGIANTGKDETATEIGRYNLLGQPIYSPTKGVNIVVYSDGSSKKIVVK